MQRGAPSPTTPTTRRGRPRDPAIDDAILDAARRVIARRGFTGASIEEIVRVAGVGKDTFYRRWASKEQLVLGLLSSLAEKHVPIPADDDPAYALFQFLGDIVRVNTHGELGAIIAGVVGEASRNPDLADAFHDFWRERRRIAASLVRDVVGDDADEDEIEAHLDHVLGPVYYRLLLTGAPVTDEYLWQLVLGLPRQAHGRD